MSTGPILTLNAGSSSIKFAVFEGADAAGRPRRALSGMVDHIGTDRAELSAARPGGDSREHVALKATDHGGAADRLLDWLARHALSPAPDAMGHRVVHGGAGHLRHRRVTPELLADLRELGPLDLDHLPREIRLMESCRRRFPDVPQIACFDTVFHRDLPGRAQRLPVPRRYFESGVRRFGFHGLSYTYLLEELERTAGGDAARGRVVLAHLGSGASMAAVRDGRPVETTMGFTPNSGLVMSTRPGDLDPGFLVQVLRTEGFDAERLDRFISHECGLLGVSGTSGDMRDLLAARGRGEVPAAEAVELFCYQARKTIGALAAALEGLDTLVFSGGIGERAAAVRDEICAGLEFLGVRLDGGANDRSEAVISSEAAPVTVRVIPTDEEQTMARIVAGLLADDDAGASPAG